MKIEDIAKLLNDKHPDSVEYGEDSLFIKVATNKWQDVALSIKDNNKLKFDYLMCISAYDCGDKEHYGVAYNFKSTSIEHYLEIRIEITDKESIPSVSNLWGSADWHEREAYDMMGLKFDNHPNFKRILLADDWEGLPLRKDYETPDYYRGMPVPKDKTYWE